MLDGFLMVFKGIFYGIVQIFNFPYYLKLWSNEGANFGVLDWILSILSFILIVAVWIAIFCLIVLAVKKRIRYKKALLSNEDLLEEITDLNREVVRLNNEKERVMQLKITQAGLSYEHMKKLLQEEMQQAAAAADGEEMPNDDARFQRLAAVDQKYVYFEPPAYNNNVSLRSLCEDLRNFACSNNGLYYDIRTIRLTIAGLAATKLIILQGISGTGKTSLPYVMGKFFKNDATIASVQPSWRDRNELFGYFNEFTKKFNETEFLRALYEANYRPDPTLIVLDEMNLARIEYYFAEMLSVLEMPSEDEWVLDLVPTAWKGDPKKLNEGKIHVCSSTWFVGTANNDDSTFTITDKVYDRAMPIELNERADEFECDLQPHCDITAEHLQYLFQKAKVEHPISEESLEKMQKLDNYLVTRFKLSFGNRIMKQMYDFIPVYVACGGTELGGMDYIIARKVLKKFESMNVTFVRDEITGLIKYIDKTFGAAEMEDSKNYLRRIQNLY